MVIEIKQTTTSKYNFFFSNIKIIVILSLFNNNNGYHCDKSDDWLEALLKHFVIFKYF